MNLSRKAQGNPPEHQLGQWGLKAWRFQTRAIVSFSNSALSTGDAAKPNTNRCLGYLYVQLLMFREKPAPNAIPAMPGGLLWDLTSSCSATCLMKAEPFLHPRPTPHNAPAACPLGRTPALAQTLPFSHGQKPLLRAAEDPSHPGRVPSPNPRKTRRLPPPGSRRRAAGPGSAQHRGQRPPAGRPGAAGAAQRGPSAGSGGEGSPGGAGTTKPAGKGLTPGCGKGKESAIPPPAGGCRRVGGARSCPSPGSTSAWRGVGLKWLEGSSKRICSGKVALDKSEIGGAGVR